MKNIILVLLSLIITLISYSQETRKELRERSPNRLVLQDSIVSNAEVVKFNFVFKFREILEFKAPK